VSNNGHNTIDKLGERITRRIASYTSRRSFLSRLGVAVVAAPVLPLLPVARAGAQVLPTAPGKESNFTLQAQTKDDKTCTYWRYCALGGDLCSCVGGGIHTCPAGAQASPTGWIGTCLNPDDQKSYLIAYHDCCGKNPAISNADEKCWCEGSDRVLPTYRPQSDNGIVWCFGSQSFAYHCSVALLVGQAS
jgi:methylamine dehydrogenase light chain